MRTPRGAAVVLAAVACVLATREAVAKKPPFGPFPVGQMDVRIRSDVPLGFCEVTLARDGVIVRRGKPDADTQALAFAGLAPGHYDLSAVCRSFVPHGPAAPHAAGRVAVWMRNGRVDQGVELRVKKKEKPEVVELKMQWSRPVAQYLIRD